PAIGCSTRGGRARHHSRGLLLPACRAANWQRRPAILPGGSLLRASAVDYSLLLVRFPLKRFHFPLKRFRCSRHGVVGPIPEPFLLRALRLNPRAQLYTNRRGVFTGVDRRGSLDHNVLVVVEIPEAANRNACNADLRCCHHRTHMLLGAI